MGTNNLQTSERMYGSWYGVRGHRGAVFYSYGNHRKKDEKDQPLLFSLNGLETETTTQLDMIRIYKK